MTESETDRPKEIEAMLVERRKFEAWLAQLDAKRDSAASHVFERVHADYTKRLEAVRSRLQDEAGTLRTMVADLEARLAKEQDRVTKKTDERAEAELRSLVGEFGEKEWNTTRSKLDTAIAELRAKFDGTERELAELKELLSSVTGAPAPARPSVTVAAAETVAEALHEFATPETPAPEPKKAVAAAEASAPPVAPPAKEEPRAPTPFDELAFLRSVAGTPSRPSGTAAVPKDPAAEPPKSTKTSRVAPPPPPPAPIVAPKPKPEPEPEPEPPAIDEAEAVATDAEEAPAPAAASANVEEEPLSSPLGGPTPRTSQAIRSLKCQECGTLNFPTEWYCERCGGELAAF